MARHDQKPPKNTFVCSNCKEYECQSCVDVVRRNVFGSTVIRMCTCNHSLYEETHAIAHSAN